VPGIEALDLQVYGGEGGPGRLFAVRTDGSVVAIAPDGEVEPYDAPWPARRIIVGGAKTYVLLPDRVVVRELGGESTSFDTPGALALASGRDGEPLVVDGQGVELLPSDSSRARERPSPSPPGLIGAAMYTDPLVWTETTLFQLHTGQTLAPTSADELGHFDPPILDAAVRPRDEAVFVLHGAPARISRVDGTKVTDVPGARAIAFGHSKESGFDPAHLYVAEKDAISLIRPD
jgi:hypothetical protein